MKHIYSAILMLLSSLTFSAPIDLDNIGGMKNQNIDIRLSNNNVQLNYDFRIPGQRVFSYNAISYNDDNEQSADITTGILIRNPTSFGSKVSIGATISALYTEESKATGFYLSVFAGLSDSNRNPNSLYYNVSASVSPNIVSIGDVDNVYKTKAEMGIHLTDGANLFIGYNYFRVNSDKINYHEIAKHPFAGISLNF